MKKIFVLAGVVGLLAARSEAQNQFDFSYTANVISSPALPGTVTGVITLNADETAATSVFVTSVTGYVTSPEPPSFNYVTGGGVLANQFTVTDGNISAADFAAVVSPVYGLELNHGGESVFGNYGGIVVNGSGLAGITFTPVAPAPEPGTLALAALGAGTLMQFRRRK